MKLIKNMTLQELTEKEELIDDLVDKLKLKFDDEWFKPERIKDENLVEDYNKYTELRRIACEPHISRLVEITRTKRFIMPYELSDIPEYGHVMSMDEFLDDVKCGGFIDYDGFGKYVKDNKSTNVTIYPSDVKNGLIRTEFTEMVWFNR